MARFEAFGDKLKGRLANIELAQHLREFVRQHLFPDIGLRAAAFVAGAAVIDVTALLDVACQGAAAMSAANEGREGKIILHTAQLLLVTSVKRILHPLEEVHRDQRRVSPFVDAPLPDEFTGIDAIVQHRMHGANRNRRACAAIRQPCLMCPLGNFLKR
ncbi:MAG: hypothetical protein R3D62_11955 [Xanthobacteraceae bacterium]